MTPDVPWDAGAGAAFGADWLLDAIAPVSSFGRRARASERAFRPGDETVAGEAIARVARAAKAVEPERFEALHSALAGAPDPGSAIARARSGGILGDADFFDLSKFLNAHESVAALARPLGEDVPEFGDVDAALREALATGRTPARAFYLADAFDPALAEARAVAASRQAAYDAARSRLAQRVAAYVGVERVRDGEFVVMRERLIAPVPPELHVLREAPTYALCELALDDAALAALAALEVAVAVVAVAEEAVRAHLTELVARAAAPLEAACDALGALDALVSRARFAQRFDCVVPQIAVDCAVAFEDARYLPLVASLEGHSRRYVPISLALSGVGVVTGPNMGGKSAALRTLGFVVACVALGVPVPAVRASIPLVTEIAWLGIGTTPEDDGLLSAFGSEVVALRAFLLRDAGRALVLIDEFARTTSPREGRALLVALLETLRQRESFGLAATHLTGIASAANAEHFAIGALGPLPDNHGEPVELELALDRIAAAMDYRLARVAEGAEPVADAIALAEALGLDRGFVTLAKAAL
ncbi:MAG: hypothetical protein IAI50_05260 [Candidatus Eremiobacteraeota bacterium]|nr:hypothetical protein [Candidatus Eremiobacteraeota bacterium]